MSSDKRLNDVLQVQVPNTEDERCVNLELAKLHPCTNDRCDDVLRSPMQEHSGHDQTVTKTLGCLSNYLAPRRAESFVPGLYGPVPSSTVDLVMSPYIEPDLSGR